MRHFAPSFAVFGFLAVSGLGLPGCDPVTDPPPDLSTAEVHHYRITSIDLPETSSEAQSVGMDLDGDLESGDQAVDNQLGAVYASMRNADSLYEVEVPAARRLTTDTAWMLSLYDGGDRGAGVRIAQGTLVGDVALPADDMSELSVGPRLPGTLTGGDSALPFGVLTDALGGAAPAWVDAQITSVAIESYDSSTVIARLGVVVTKRDADPVVLANLSAFFTWALGIGRSDYGELVDTNHDLVVSEDEMLANTVFQGMMSPDVILDPNAASLGDEGISLGFRIVATAQ